jgi:hypothetical protein
VATTAVADAVSLLTQRVKKRTLRRPTVREAERPFIVHLLYPATLRKQLNRADLD